MFLFRTEVFKKIIKWNRLFSTKSIGNLHFKNYCSQSRILINLNTNVVKDVLLFKYDTPTYFKYLNLFGISQFAFWMYLSHFAFTSLKDAPVSKESSENLPWWRKINLGEQNYRNGISLFCGIVGKLNINLSSIYFKSLILMLIYHSYLYN